MIFEFQAKGTLAIEFTLAKMEILHPDSYPGGEKKIKFFNDGERIIASVIEEKFVESKLCYKLCDTQSDTAWVSSEQFHKIVNPKNFSKKFIAYKVANRITD